MKHLITLAALLLPAAVDAQDLERGEQLFWMHCAACHGTEGRGDGPMAPAMLVQPRNLTVLAAENDFVFPTERVIRRIDGTDPLVSHGSEMPVYGPFFAVDDTPTKTETGQPIMTSSPVVDLVAYLKTLQADD
ncbi:cytochrome c [uncultured Tateyamaria sp.]|uniref:c-type cytochrome n=1 Tax=Tateyamaria sp. 1078 TaxID=3417464 RepID=UPI002616B390|nr:cytochrome c [uncultured Tateyamaria sp.]